MTTWLQLRSSALVGVARRPIETMTVAGIDLDKSGVICPEERVLAAAALLGTERRAGARPPGGGMTAPDAVVEDPRPSVSPHAAQLLELVLGGAAGRGDDADALLVHWFQWCVAAGERPPDHLVVDVLTAATDRPALRGSARSALGTTGRWLAALREGWTWAAESLAVIPTKASRDEHSGVIDHAPLYEEWATASAPERVTLLARARAMDRSLPRLLVESTWAVDNAGDREAALVALVGSRNSVNESLFERALDDRSKKVRAIAVNALDSLPASARAERLAARLRPLVRHRGPLRGSLTVELPDDPDEQAVRDGLGDPPSRSSRRLWWLQRLVIGAPLRLWTDLTGKPADQVVRMAVEPAQVIEYWAAAAVAQRDVMWAAALFARTAQPELLTVLPRESAFPLVERAVRTGLRPDAALRLASRIGGRWTPSLSEAIVECFRKAAKASDAATLARLGWLLPGLASHLDSSVVPALEAWRKATDDAPLDRQLRHLINHLSTFDAITAAFATGAPTA